MLWYGDRECVWHGKQTYTYTNIFLLLIFFFIWIYLLLDDGYADRRNGKEQYSRKIRGIFFFKDGPILGMRTVDIPSRVCVCVWPGLGHIWYIFIWYNIECSLVTFPMSEGKAWIWFVISNEGNSHEFDTGRPNIWPFTIGERRATRIEERMENGVECRSKSKAWPNAQ